MGEVFPSFCGAVSAVEHRQHRHGLLLQHTSRNTFEIWPVVSSYMRKRFEHWSAHTKLGHNAVSSTAMFVVKTSLLNNCKAIDTKHAERCWCNRMAASNPCCLKQVVPSNEPAEALHTARKNKHAQPTVELFMHTGPN